MSLYGDAHRALHEQFDTRKMAARLEEMDADDVSEQHKAFIESRDMFWLATVDEKGRPQCQYKGGERGFVRVVDPKTVIFPSYNGNGRFHSMGNIRSTASIGMLFLDFETPNRLRLQGQASVSSADPWLSEYHEAELIIRVNVTDVIINCPRYIHKMKRTEMSRHVPKVGTETPHAEWKRIDMIQDVLSEADQDKTIEFGGVITIEEWEKNRSEGNG